MSDLEAELAALLNQYSADIAEEVKQACKEVSSDMTDNIRRDSPKDKGKYAKGWKTKVEYEDKNNIRIKTYNVTDYQLTHLLEFGHAKQNGGRVEGNPHIGPNEEKAKRDLLERIEEAVQK